MDRKKISIEDIRWCLGHNDIATTQTYIMNNKGKVTYSWVLKTPKQKPQKP